MPKKSIILLIYILHEILDFIHPILIVFAFRL
jgi:hypothetical protein